VKKIAIFFGGASSEHEISILTALQVLDALDPSLYKAHPVYIHQNGRWYTGEPLFEKRTYLHFDKYKKNLQEVTLLPQPHIQGLLLCSDFSKKIDVDVCLIACHGQIGEDGHLQALLEMAQLPYTGFSFAASALAMDKYLCNRYLSSQQIPVLDQFSLYRNECVRSFSSSIDKALKNLPFSFPIIVKPRHLGSSIGISACFTKEELEKGVAKALSLDSSCVLEPYLQNKLEINVSVLEGTSPRASVVEVPVPSEKGQLLSFEDKYLRGQKGQGEGMASMTRLINPGSLSSKIKERARLLSLEIFRLLEGKGFARLDFLYDLDLDSLYFNEINPIPGSFAYYLWEKSTPPLLFCDLLDELINKALFAQKERLSLKKAPSFLALK